jgi:hypothetical protein
MIVRPLGDRVQLITQPDHAHLARRIMERCVPLARRPRREAILRAIGEHDAGWEELDAAPQVDPVTGAVVDFVRLPLADRQAVWPRSVARLAGHPWSAALVAQHALTAYERFRAAAEWAAFFAELGAMRDELVAASGLSLEELLADYGLVRLGDLASLAFCTGSTDALHYGEWTVRRMGMRVVVAPDTFGGEEVPLEITAREVHPPFGSDDELRQALAAARATTLRGVVAGTG